MWIRRKCVVVALCMALMAQPVPAAGTPAEDITDITASMTLEQKVSQMIMPCIRFWGNEGVSDLSACPELAGILRRHQYGGIILFEQNVVGTEQTVRLVHDLQVNNAQSDDASETGVIPYLIAADQEGGAVARLSMGTRGTGSMAIGATGPNAEDNAYAIGRVFGEELSALGINLNLGPCIDVIANLADLGMSTRVFSDDPEVVSALGQAFERGVSESNVITCFKHFPGAGDGSDYPTSIPLTPEQLRDGGFSAFATAIENGAEMVMTAATTFPLVDEAILMPDGETEGYYPATLSHLIIQDMLREELGFDGVVMTDALEMQQFVREPDNEMEFFTGAAGSIEHDVPVAEKAINAGCDILLIPTDLNCEEAAEYYEEYIADIAQLVRDGAIPMERIDESVNRILELKERHGVMDMDLDEAALEGRLESALRIVGSPEHHEVEARIAAQAVTLLKNDNVLPFSDDVKRVAIICRTVNDNYPVSYALDKLKEDGTLPKNTRIENRISGKTTGDEEAAMSVVIDHYYDTVDGGTLIYPEELTAAIRDSDVVIGLSSVGAGMERLQDDNPAMAGLSAMISDTHASGSKFILLSDNLPVDAARFQEADAIVCAYLSAGFGIDPALREEGTGNAGAYNANVPAALCAIFGDGEMEGRLPITIPALEMDADGQWVYGDTVLYHTGE